MSKAEESVSLGARKGPRSDGQEKSMSFGKRWTDHKKSGIYQVLITEHDTVRGTSCLGSQANAKYRKDLDFKNSLIKIGTLSGTDVEEEINFI